MKSIWKTIFLLDGFERKDSIDADKGMLIMVVSNNDLAHSVLHLWLCFSYCLWFVCQHLLLLYLNLNLANCGLSLFERRLFYLYFRALLSFFIGSLMGNMGWQSFLGLFINFMSYWFRLNHDGSSRLFFL